MGAKEEAGCGKFGDMFVGLSKNPSSCIRKCLKLAVLFPCFLLCKRTENNVAKYLFPPQWEVQKSLGFLECTNRKVVAGVNVPIPETHPICLPVLVLLSELCTCIVARGARPSALSQCVLHSRPMLASRTTCMSPCSTFSW